MKYFKNICNYEMLLMYVHCTCRVGDSNVRWGRVPGAETNSEFKKNLQQKLGSIIHYTICPRLSFFF